MKIIREFNSEYDFIKKYGRKYPTHKLDTDYHSSTMVEIQQMKYASNNLKYYDIYESLVNKLLELGFDIGCNMLDVASGYYPAFGYEIAGRQLQLDKGTITCIVPNLVVDKPLFKNIKLVKKNFTEKYNLNNYELIVSRLPCECTNILFRIVLKSEKDFFIMPCNCNSIYLKRKTWEDMYDFV